MGGDFPGQEQPTGDFSDFSDDEALQPQFQPPPSRHGSLFSTIGSSDMAHLATIDRNEYSDEDIKIVYEIVTRAETILAEDLTPTSRLPTHALFLAYDEILAEYGIDPSERHISKVVLMVGGVKGERSLLDKFKAVMARMHITLAIEEPQGSEGEHEDREGPLVANGAEDHRMMDDEHIPNAHIDEAESNDYKASSDHVPDLSIEALSETRERHLRNKAEAFRKKHHTQFLAVATLRRWHNSTQQANYLSAQSDAIREAEMIEGLEEKFNIWRAKSTKATYAAPDSIPPNAFSKRTERVAIRAHEILLAKKALIGWRQSTWDEYCKNRNAQLLADQRARQEYEEEDFKENPHLARLAQRAHRNLVLSRAFATWSNRAEEEVAKAEVAAKAYEMSLKAKALGFARNRSVIDSMRQLLASKTGGAVDSTTSQVAAPEPQPPVLPVPAIPAITNPISAAPIPSRPHLPSTRPLSSAAIATQLQTRRRAEKHTASSAARPSTIIPVTTVPPDPPPVEEVDARARASASASASVEPVVVADSTEAADPTEDADPSDDDELDERTMLARRHILRMRYFGAWEKYTSENLAKVAQFREERQDQRLSQSVSTWRDQVTSKRQQAVDVRFDFEDNRSYQRGANAVTKWRQRSGREEHRRAKVLEYYAERAEYYSKTTKALPVLRGKAAQAEQKDKLLALYADRTNYYLRATQALSTWRERAQQVSEVHQLQEHYGERADYYYRTRNTVSTWQQKTKQRRKESLREAHLETRRIVKRGMGERCIRQWRNKLVPSYERYELMNVALMNATEDREWRQTSQAFTEWRRRAQERNEAAVTGDDMLMHKALEQWRNKAALHRDFEAGAGEHWEVKAKSRALKSWNLSSLQSANRPEMVAKALEKKGRKLLRQGFETWYGQTADMLVPVQLPDGTYRNVGQVVEGARQQAVEHQARGFLDTWRAAAANRPANPVQQEEYAPTPGRPRLLLGSYLGRREMTTPLAPVPSHLRWQDRDSAMRRSDFGARVGPSERTARNARNLRVSWAA
ncbi:hypothetical protein F4825DRAFT_434641 [Nemania diffusa]|nr:hypothetical protein F4825DRAFT_434641 [Nemania diffusa]